MNNKTRIYIHMAQNKMALYSLSTYCYNVHPPCGSYTLNDMQ